MSELRDKATRLLLKSAWEMLMIMSMTCRLCSMVSMVSSMIYAGARWTPWRVSAVCPVRRLTMMKWNV